MQGLKHPATVIALIALFVALGGTGYAALRLPKNSVGSAQLKKNAVTPGKVAKTTIRLFKGQRGEAGPQGPQGAQGVQGPQGIQGVQGVPGPTFAAAGFSSTVGGTDPPASPDETSAQAQFFGTHFDFTLPTAGKLYIRFFIPAWGMNCSAGSGNYGLYLDGSPIPKTSLPLSDNANPRVTDDVAVTGNVASGAHSLEARYDCPSGSVSSVSWFNPPDWTVLLLG